LIAEVGSILTAFQVLPSMQSGQGYCQNMKVQASVTQATLWTGKSLVTVHVRHQMRLRKRYLLWSKQQHKRLRYCTPTRHAAAATAIETAFYQRQQQRTTGTPAEQRLSTPAKRLRGMGIKA